MVGSAGQFSRPLGVGGYWSYSGWQIFEMAMILKEWQYSEGMTKIQKEWQKFERNDKNLEGMTKIRKEWQYYGRNNNNAEVFSMKKICFSN